VTHTVAVLRFDKALLVARFDLLEALRSKTATLLALVYAAGAFIGTSVFLYVLHGAEDAAREALTNTMKVPADELPRELIREKALPWLLTFVQDEDTRQQLLQMDPLSIFFGFGTLQIVALLVMMPATAGVGAELERGSTRFVLLRCDRLSWGVGKVMSQAVLLAVGLSFAALTTALTGTWIDSEFDPLRLLWLVRTAARTWVFGMAYVGVFVGISLVAGSVAKARLSAVIGWLGLTVTASLLRTRATDSPFAALDWLTWLLPTAHQGSLWSANLLTFWGAVVALLAIGVLGFGVGSVLFRSRDA